MFKEKKNTYDTLKSYYIFKNDVNWDEDATKEINIHKTEMIDVIKKHYKI
jgi:hypothetical protein